MDILCLMGLFPKQFQAEIEKQSIRGIQYAANKLQWAIVDGLSQNEDITLSLLNSLYIGSYPKRYRKLMIPTFEFDDMKNAKNIGFCNLSVFKYFSRYYGIKKEIKKWAEKDNGEEKALLIYALAMPFTNIAKYVTKHYPQIKVCIVVPDLPEYMNTSASEKSLYRNLKNISIKLIKKQVNKVNRYVLLTDAMKNWFDRPIQYTVVEGIAGNIGSAEESLKKKEKTILYAGGIKAEYGVLELVQAFAEIGDKEWKLEIYGDGSDMEKLRIIAKDCTNILVMGSTPNEVVVERQKSVSLLVNPRKNQPFTKYSFPSKIMEYMSSGTPMLGYMLDGMPEEYKGYFYEIEDKEGGLLDALRSVMSLSETERKLIGNKAKDFVKEHKNAKAQCSKIVNLLRS